MACAACPGAESTVTNVHTADIGTPRSAATPALRWVVFAAAIVGLHAGAAALVRSGVGADPYGAFVSSFTDRGVTPGAAVAAFTVAAVAACWAAGMRPRAGTIAILAAGPILFDAFWVLLEAQHGWALWAAGFTLIVTCAATVAAAAVGPGAPELIALTAQHHRIDIRVAAWVRDATFAAAATIFGGQVGVGTIACAAGFSPLFGAVYRRVATALGTHPTAAPAP